MNIRKKKKKTIGKKWQRSETCSESARWREPRSSGSITPTCEEEVAADRSEVGLMIPCSSWALRPFCHKKHSRAQAGDPALLPLPAGGGRPKRIATGSGAEEPKTFALRSRAYEGCHRSERSRGLSWKLAGAYRLLVLLPLSAGSVGSLCTSCSLCTVYQLASSVTLIII